MPSGTSSRCQATWRIVNVSVRGASRSLASVSLGCVVRQVGGDDVVRAHHPPCLAELTEIRWSPTAGSTFSTAFCKVERRPSNQTVSSTASHRPSNIPFAWFILFERNRQAWGTFKQTKQGKCWDVADAEFRFHAGNTKEQHNRPAHNSFHSDNIFYKPTFL